MNMKRCILDPKLTRQMMSRHCCVKARRGLSGLVGDPWVIREDGREMRGKKFGETRVDVKRQVLAWWEMNAHSVVTPKSWGNMGQGGCCGGEEQLRQAGKGESFV